MGDAMRGATQGATQGDEGFAAVYGGAVKSVFMALARQAVERGEDALTLARGYAERGKPEFALAFLLLAGGVADEEKRAALALAYERRASVTETRARELDARFHRPFPLLFTEANKDRAQAKRIREGEAGAEARSGVARRLPLL